MTLKSKANLNKTTKGNLQNSKKMRTNKSKKNSFRSNKNKAKNQRRLSKSTKKYSKSNQRGGKPPFSSFLKNLYPSSNSPTPENDDLREENSPTPENDDSRKEKLELILNDIKTINDSKIIPAFRDFDFKGEKGYWYEFPISRNGVTTKSIWVLQKSEPSIKDRTSNSQGNGNSVSQPEATLENHEGNTSKQLEFKSGLNPNLKAVEEARLTPEEEEALLKKFLSEELTDQKFEQYLKGRFSNLEILLRKKVSLTFSNDSKQSNEGIIFAEWNSLPDDYHVSLPSEGGSYYSLARKFVDRKKKDTEHSNTAYQGVRGHLKYPEISLVNHKIPVTELETDKIPVTELETDLLKCYCHNEISKERRSLESYP